MERYEELQMEIIAFENEDIVTVSDPNAIELVPTGN